MEISEHNAEIAYMGRVQVPKPKQTFLGFYQNYVSHNIMRCFESTLVIQSLTTMWKGIYQVSAKKFAFISNKSISHKDSISICVTKLSKRKE